MICQIADVGGGGGGGGAADVMVCGAVALYILMLILSRAPHLRLMMVVTQDWSWGIVGYNWGSMNVMGGCGLVDDCIETVVIVSGVVNGTH